ncbi:MAG: VWA domain-containing protein, partial [Bacteroidetes bacterium]|nr:VWA domain-containing protein [Bacteroidota bacterium]
MNKKLIVNLVLLISIFGLLYFLPGCSKDEEIIIPDTDQIFANGSLTPTSRTQVQGNMFVTDENGNPIQGLDASNIVARLRWNAKDSPPDSVTGFVTITQATQNDIAAALTMDYSGSMGSLEIQCMEDGVTAYINSMSASDITEIIKFASTVQVMQAFTNNKTLLLQAVNTTPSVGTQTALYQSIYQGLLDANGISSSQYIRTVIAFTDGGENNSTVSLITTINQALNTGIPVFTVTLTDYPTGAAADTMRIIADTTGGFPFVVDPDSCSQLNNIYQQINSQLNNAYSLTIDWPDTNPPLPITGTPVTAVVYVTYEGLTAVFQRTYNIP